jgi:sugar phosphate permease
MMNLLKDTNVHLENKRISRIFFIFIWIAYALVYMTKSSFSGALSAIVAEGALTLTQASMINAAFYAVYTPLQILGGVFADKYSPERLVMIGLLGSAVANAIIFLNQNFIVMLLAWIFNAIIQFSLWPAIYKIISSQLVRSDRANMVFFISFASSGGLLINYAVSAVIPKWQYSFAISTVTLVALAVAMLFFCRCFNPSLVKDRPVETVSKATAEGEAAKTPLGKLFLMSGFYALLIAVLVRAMVENGTKTLSATMLFQSYESISPMIGNLLNTLIILAGVAGTVAVRFLVFPKIIKNELVMFLLLLSLSIPFAVLLRFVGKLPVGIVVAALATIAFLLTPTVLCTQHYNMSFTKYGRNGTAAGVLNAAASLGFTLQFCVFGPVAENLGWPIVTTIWIVMIALGGVSIAFAIRPFKRFKGSE